MKNNHRQVLTKILLLQLHNRGICPAPQYVCLSPYLLSVSSWPLVWADAADMSLTGQWIFMVFNQQDTETGMEWW